MGLFCFVVPDCLARTADLQMLLRSFQLLMVSVDTNFENHNASRDLQKAREVLQIQYMKIFKNHPPKVRKRYNELGIKFQNTQSYKNMIYIKIQF